MAASFDLILASASPRRAELLTRLGVEFQAIPSHIDEEVLAGEEPDGTVLRLARTKARALVSQLPNDGSESRYIVAADTAIAFEGGLLGKPDDESDAVAMLMRLSGRSHHVLTAVCVLEVASGRVVDGVVASEVTMVGFDRTTAMAYAATGEPLDKAGSYAIQGRGSRLVARWSGCYNNIVGLPVCELAREIRKLRPAAAIEPASCRLPDGRPCPRLVDDRSGQLDDRGSVQGEFRR